MEIGRQTAPNRPVDLTQFVNTLSHAAHDRLTSALWAAADYYEDTVLIGAVRLREVVIKLQSALRLEDSIPLGQRMRRIGTCAAGVVAMLILIVAPTSAASQLASYTNGVVSGAAQIALYAEATASVSGVSFTAENEYLPDGSLTPTAANYEANIYSDGTERFLSSGTDDIHSDAADPAGVPDNDSVSSLELSALDAVYLDELMLTPLSQSLHADSMDAADRALAESQMLMQQHNPEAMEPEPESSLFQDYDRADDANWPTVTSSTYILYSGNYEDETPGAYVNGYRAGTARDVWPDANSAADSSYIWPAEGNLYSLFGRRITSIGSVNHLGIDISGRSGTPIYAADEGAVIFSGWNRTYGYYIKIEHDNGHVTLYSHCNELLVEEGERVEQGQQIARMGRTGLASGVHLHFEIIINDVNVNPLRYLP